MTSSDIQRVILGLIFAIVLLLIIIGFLLWAFFTRVAG